jgi:DNA-binding NarL/FixJ family response regulator
VKIQHLGKRKTYALTSPEPARAAEEACHIFLKLAKPAPTETGEPQWARNLSPDPSPRHAAAGYWRPRLIQREYTMKLGAEPRPELSVRLEHASASHYIPLGTADREQAAEHAAQLSRIVQTEGWETFNRKYRRELTLAFRWLDSPLAWTYTTIHTVTMMPPASARPTPAHPVVIVETDAGIRNALNACIDAMDGFRCAGAAANAQQAVWEVMRTTPRLILVNHSFAEKSGAVLLAELRAVAPQAAGLLYSVYEDSEELFKGTPGGAGIYVLQRLPAAGFLEPIVEMLKRGPFTSAAMATGVWEYFRERVTRMPVGNASRAHSNLTQREHEVLGLLSRGYPDKDIADHLTISIHTVHEHVRNIFEKLGVHNRTEAVVKFLQK